MRTTKRAMVTSGVDYVAGKSRVSTRPYCISARKEKATVNGRTALEPTGVLVSGSLPPGSHTEEWDGRNLEGSFIYDSAFIASLCTVIPENSVIVSNSFDIQDLSVDGYVLFSTYDQVNHIKYTLTRDANVTVTIYDPQGVLFRTLVDDELQTAGDYSIEWDGKNAGGEIPQERGNYMIVVSATETTGVKTVEKNANTVVYK